jgi:hypothetical protein
MRRLSLSLFERHGCKRAVGTRRQISRSRACWPFYLFGVDEPARGGINELNASVGKIRFQETAHSFHC